MGKEEKNNPNKEGEVKMNTLTKPRVNTETSYMANIKKMAQEAIQKKGLSEEQIKKILGIKRYEKED